LIETHCKIILASLKLSVKSSMIFTMNRLIFASTRDSDMHYAVKTNITSPFFYLEKGKRKYAFLDKRDFGLVPRKAKVKSIAIERLAEAAKSLKSRTSDRNKIAYTIFKKYKLFSRKVEVPTHFQLDMADFLRARGAKLVPTYPFFPERAIKNKAEIKYIKECLAHTKIAFRIIEDILRKSRIRGSRIFFRNKILTCEFLKQEAEKALLEKGMFDLLGMIISTGAQTATPHHDGSGPILPCEPIVCDIFPRHRKTGYFADMTRTYVKGKPSPEIQKMYSAVLEAQSAAIKKIKSGVSARKIYDIAAEAITKSGFDVGEKGLIHGIGHGVGLDIHEKPSLKPNSEDILEAGNVITVEPGLYYPKIGLARRSPAKAAGVRIEDMILVTKTGCRNLTNYPKKLVIQ